MTTWRRGEVERCQAKADVRWPCRRAGASTAQGQPVGSRLTAAVESAAHAAPSAVHGGAHRARPEEQAAQEGGDGEADER
eukprot:CAMPEP_0196699982 /NCGR_PEP_ID=MMETSP1090-20130531/48294_1 /TAXON_ID=37098 /ORGANISM="Isochrysis sp, Strain CCMP1244" /LENGTH=79 /DNA_ID=CAMNT_0042039705 /DNA_START=276 /DNA_END=513 /DNA_ORIENTATION=-